MDGNYRLQEVREMGWLNVSGSSHDLVVESHQLVVSTVPDELYIRLSFFLVSLSILPLIYGRYLSAPSLENELRLHQPENGDEDSRLGKATTRSFTKVEYY